MIKRKYGSRSMRSRHKWFIGPGIAPMVYLLFWLTFSVQGGYAVALPIVTLQADVTSAGILLDGVTSKGQVTEQRAGHLENKPRAIRQDASEHIQYARGHVPRGIAATTESTQEETSDVMQVRHEGLEALRAPLAVRAEEDDPKDRKTKSDSKSSKTSTSKSSRSSATTESSKLKEEEKAGGLPLYQMFVIFVFVVVGGGGVVWYFHRKKMIKIEQERRQAAKKLREQYEWEREMKEIPNPEAEMEADQYVENLPYAPEGLFYETVNPLAVEGEANETNEANEKWRMKRQHQPHHQHHPHHGHHHKQKANVRKPPPVRAASRSVGDSFYEQQFSRVAPQRY